MYTGNQVSFLVGGKKFHINIALCRKIKKDSTYAFKREIVMIARV